MGFEAVDPATGDRVEHDDDQGLRAAIEARGGDPDQWRWSMTAIPPGAGGFASGWPKRKRGRWPWEGEDAPYPRPPIPCRPIPPRRREPLDTRSDQHR